MKMDWTLITKIATVAVAIGGASIGAYVNLKEDVAVLKRDVSGIQTDVDTILREMRANNRANIAEQ